MLPQWSGPVYWRWPFEWDDQPEPAAASDFCRSLAVSKKWWLLSIVAGLLLVGLFVLFNSTGAASFIEKSSGGNTQEMRTVEPVQIEGAL